MKGQKLFLPVTKFSKVPPTEFSAYDDRYIPAEIVVMHSGINSNQSLFTDESIASASWSLTDIPILGFIKSINDTEHDFDEHNVEVVLTDDDIKVKALGRIIGNIPQNNNYHYTYFPEKNEMYVVVEGYLWAEYMNEALEIFKANNKKGVSMEIIVDDGFLDDDGIFCITNYRYLGICILGDDVKPAMTGAKITVDNTPLEYYSHKSTEEEVMNLDKIKEEVKDEVIVDEYIDEEVKDEKDEVEDTPIAEPAEETEVEESKTEEPEIDEPEANEEPEKEETPFEEVSEVRTVLTDEERAELEELRLFKSTVEKEQRELEIKELFATSDAKGLDISKIKENSDGKTVEEIKSEIALMLLENTFSVKEQTLPDDDSKAVVKDVSKIESSPYGKYSDRVLK